MTMSIFSCEYWPLRLFFGEASILFLSLVSSFFFFTVFVVCLFGFFNGSLYNSVCPIFMVRLLPQHLKYWNHRSATRGLMFWAFINWILFFLLLLLRCKSPNIFQIWIPYQIYNLQVFSPFCVLNFHLKIFFPCVYMCACIHGGAYGGQKGSCPVWVLGSELVLW